MWEQLVEIVSRETETEHDEIMLLRYSDARIVKLRRYGGSIEEYTSVQSIDSKYDFAKSDEPLIRLVVVIVDNSVYRVYAVSGIQAQGMNRKLQSNEVNKMHIDLGRPEVPARRFVITEVNTSVVGKRVRGWEEEQLSTDVLHRENSNAVRYNSEMFFEIEVESESVVREQSNTGSQERSRQNLAFWTQFVDQNEGEDGKGKPASSQHFRWWPVENADFVISLNLALDKVILFIRAPRNKSHETARERLRSRESELTSRFGVPMGGETTGYFFQDKKLGDYTAVDECEQLIAWLDERGRLYRETLQELFG